MASDNIINILHNLITRINNNDLIYDHEVNALINHHLFNIIHEDINTREMLQRILEYNITSNTNLFPDYTTETRDSTISFYSNEYRGMRRFRSNVTTYRLDRPLVVDHSNIYTISRFINNAVDERSGTRPYLITLYDTSRSVIFNKRPSDIESALYDISDQYTGFFSLDEIVIRRTITNETYSNQHASCGEGIPRRCNNGFWLIDISRTKKYCLLQVYISWQYYASQIKMPNSDDMKLLKKKLSNNIDKHSILDISMLRSISNNNVIVITSLDDLSSISPSDTISNIVCYISCNHATLVVHESYMTKDDKIWQEYRSRCTFVQPILYIPKSSSNTNLLTADIECYRDTSHMPHIKHIPLVASIYDGYNARQFVGEDCVHKLLSHLTTIPKPIIWLHNAGNYDSHIILEHALRIADNTRYNPIDIVDLNGSIVTMIIYLSNTNIITIKDSYKLLPVSLAKLSEHILGETKDDVDIVNATYDQITSPKYLEYNIMDSVLLYNVLDKISTMLPNILAHDTLPSYAKGMFFGTYYDPNYTLYVLPKWIHDKLHMGYKGGRNEIYYRGTIRGPIYIYDVNSMYPNSGTNDLPYSKPVHNINVNKIATKEYMMRNYGFHIVTIILTNSSVRPLHGLSYNGKLVFPICYNTRCMLFSEEIIKGISIGNKYYIHESIVFMKHPIMRDLFNSIYYNKKTSTDDSSRLIWKLISNSSYGFMGFKKYDRVVIKCYGYNAADHVISSHISGNSIFTKYDDKDIYLSTEKIHALLTNTNIAIASAITSYARIHLYDIITDVENYGGKILYCDTDSIVTDICLEHIEPLNTKYIGTDIGMLKREYSNSTIDEITIASNKIYGLKSGNNYIVKIRGIDTTRLVTDDGRIYNSTSHEHLYKDLCRCLYTNVPMTIRSSSIVRSRDNKIMHDAFLEEVVIDKTITLDYTKGIVDSLGNVRPLILKNISCT